MTFTKSSGTSLTWIHDTERLKNLAAARHQLACWKNHALLGGAFRACSDATGGLEPRRRCIYGFGGLCPKQAVLTRSPALPSHVQWASVACSMHARCTETCRSLQDLENANPSLSTKPIEGLWRCLQAPPHGSAQRRCPSAVAPVPPVLLKPLSYYAVHVDWA